MSIRKIIISAVATVALLFGSGAMDDLYAQHYIGARVGFGSGSSRFYPKEDMGTMWGRYSGGVSWKYFSAERYLGGIEIDVLYMQRGFKRMGDYVAREFGGYTDDDTGVYERTINSVMVPIFWQPHAYLFRRKVRVFLNLGVTFSYNINSRHKATTSHPDIPGGILMEEQKYSMLLTRDNSWGYGLCFGPGLGWSVGRMEVFAEARYYFGLSDILRNPNKYESNPYRSPMDDMQFSAGIFLRLGKGGVLAEPSRRVQQKLERLELEKMSRDMGDVVTDGGVGEEALQGSEIELPTEIVGDQGEPNEDIKSVEQPEKSKKELKREIKELKKEIATDKKRDKEEHKNDSEVDQSKQAEESPQPEESPKEEHKNDSEVDQSKQAEESPQPE